MIHIRESTIIEAPAEDVWRLLRDFNAHDRWHPAIASSNIEGGGPPDAVGAVRDFRLSDGGRLREQLIKASDRDMCLTYCLLDAPVPLNDYVAHMRVRPVTAGNACFLEWWSSFDPPAGEADALTALVRDSVYLAGFRALKDWFGGVPQNVPPPRTVPTVVSKPTNPQATAVLAERHGGPDVMRLRAIDLPMPTAGEVRIAQSFVGVNFIDVHTRTGHFNLIVPPAVPGMEAVGTVDAIGPDVDPGWIGRRVGYACAPPGAYCSHRCIPTQNVIALPDALSDARAASCLLRGVTVSFLTREVHDLKPGEIVIVHAAAGGVGQILLQTCKAMGATAIATAGSDAGVEVSRSLGADLAINYHREDVAEATMAFTDGQGADVIFDGVGALTFAGSIRAAALRGHVVSYGEASGDVGPWDIGSLSAKSLRISRPNYGHYMDGFAQYAERFFEMVTSGSVRIPDPVIYPMAEAAKAHRDLEARAFTGACVLEV
jgi:NADPH:quinone reductase-like Zn-dependent oxidoreductase